MKLNKCTACGTTFLVKRLYCPKCHSDKVEEVQITDAVVVRSLELIATPEPFPDAYYLVYAEHHGTGFFCRSEKELTKGAPIAVSEDEYGWICSETS